MRARAERDVMRGRNAEHGLVGSKRGNVRVLNEAA